MLAACGTITLFAPAELILRSPRVATKGKHLHRQGLSAMSKKRHWASLGTSTHWQRIAISEKFYRDVRSLLEESLGRGHHLHNDEEDDYAFYIEDLRPIKYSRFDFDATSRGRNAFGRNEGGLMRAAVGGT